MEIPDFSLIFSTFAAKVTFQQGSSGKTRSFFFIGFNADDANHTSEGNQGRDLTGLQGRRARRPTINNTGQKHVRYTGNGNIWKD